MLYAFAHDWLMVGLSAHREPGDILGEIFGVGVAPVEGEDRRAAIAEMAAAMGGEVEYGAG